MSLKFLSSDDIFISYSRADGAGYATGLADKLTEAGFSCFIDKLGTEPDHDLPKSLKTKIRSCAMLVLVSTKGGAASEFVEKEIAEFLKTERTIVPIDFNGAVAGARWYHLIPGLASEPEKNERAIETGEPSGNVIGRIEKSFKYTRRNQRMLRLFWATAALFTVLVFSALAAGYWASINLEKANQAVRDETVAKASAASANAEVRRQRDAAQQAGDEARRQGEAAERQVMRAREANEHRIRAEKQERQANALARVNRVVAAASADSMQFPERALIATVEASRRAEAAGQSDLPIVVQSLLSILQQLGGRGFRTVGPVGALEFSPDGAVLAVASDKPGVEFWNVRSQPAAPAIPGPPLAEYPDFLKLSANGHWLVARAMRQVCVSALSERTQSACALQWRARPEQGGHVPVVAVQPQRRVGIVGHDRTL